VLRIAPGTRQADQAQTELAKLQSGAAQQADFKRP
jgi:hypothetical protein